MTNQSQPLENQAAAREIAANYVNHREVTSVEDAERSIQSVISKHLPDGGVKTYHCSCGAACTAEEYIEHYFEKGHDRGRSDSGEVERLQNETQRLRALLAYDHVEDCAAFTGAGCDCWNDDKHPFDTVCDTARANAIREAVDKVWSLKNGGAIDTTTELMVSDPDGCWFTQSEIATALQGLLDKKEGEDNGMV